MAWPWTGYMPLSELMITYFMGRIYVSLGPKQLIPFEQPTFLYKRINMVEHILPHFYHISFFTTNVLKSVMCSSSDA